MRFHHFWRAGAAAACAATLVASALVAPAGAQVQSAESAAQALPHIKAKATKVAVTLQGHRGLRAGRVRMSVAGASTVEIARFARGYGIEKFASDVERAFLKGDMKALRRSIANTTILGGFAPGHTGTIVLPRAGRYTAFAIGDPETGVIAGPTFRVGPKKKRPMPDVDGRIIAKRGLSWGGSSHLPAAGTFLFKNKRTAGVPHFVVMQQVEEGTTVDQVLEFLQSGEGQGPPPSWLMRGAMDTGTLSPGRSMTVDYDLPPGQYAVLCFFPDPKMDGMPHAMMGMIEMIHLM